MMQVRTYLIRIIPPNQIAIDIPPINDIIGNNTYDSDDARSDYSRGSWYHIPTPFLCLRALLHLNKIIVVSYRP